MFFRRHLCRWLRCLTKMHGNAASDIDGDGKTSLSESFAALRVLNPILKSGTLNDRMDPQMCRNQSKTVDNPNETLDFPELGVAIQPNVPFEQDAVVTVNKGPFDADSLFADGVSIEGVVNNEMWSIDVEQQTEPINVDLFFSFDNANLSPELEQSLGIIRRLGSNSPWIFHAATTNVEIKLVIANEVDQSGDFAVVVTQ